jgi:hypothetical protein
MGEIIMEKVKNYLMTLCSKDRSAFLLTLARTAIELVYLILLLLAFFTIRGDVKPVFFNVFAFDRTIPIGSSYFLISLLFVFVFPFLLISNASNMVKPLAVARFIVSIAWVLFIILMFVVLQDIIATGYTISLSLSFFLLIIWIGIAFISAFKPELISKLLDKIVPASFLAVEPSGSEAVVVEPAPVIELEPKVEPEPIVKPEPVVEPESKVEVEPVVEPDPVVEPAQEPAQQPESISEPKAETPKDE